jgi:predicted nucleotidyltransferase
MHRKGNKGFEYNREIISRLSHIIPEIVDAFDPDEIILYGSFARGKNIKDTDIDLIIVADTPLRFQDRAIRTLEVVSDNDNDIPINPIVYTPKEFADMLQKKESFLILALKESILIWKKQAGVDITTQLETHALESEFKKYLEDE